VITVYAALCCEIKKLKYEVSSALSIHMKDWQTDKGLLFCNKQDKIMYCLKNFCSMITYLLKDKFMFLLIGRNEIL